MQVLLPESVARHNGIGAEIALEAARGKVLLLTLEISRIIEQESMEMSIWGSTNGSAWKVLTVFPKKYYCGTYLQALDLGTHPEIEYLRAEWKVSRWGGAESSPLFEFSVALEELKLQAVGA